MANKNIRAACSLSSQTSTLCRIGQHNVLPAKIVHEQWKWAHSLRPAFLLDTVATNVLLLFGPKMCTLNIQNAIQKRAPASSATSSKKAKHSSTFEGAEVFGSELCTDPLAVMYCTSVKTPASTSQCLQQPCNRSASNTDCSSVASSFHPGWSCLIMHTPY